MVEYEKKKMKLRVSAKFTSKFMFSHTRNRKWKQHEDYIGEESVFV